MKKRGVTVDIWVNCPPNFKPDSSMISDSEGRMVHELQQLHHQEKRMTLEFNEPSDSAKYYKGYWYSPDVLNVVDVTEFSHAEAKIVA